MKFNFRRIAPILASAVMLGSTIGFAAAAGTLADYPSPFVAGGHADVTIVYGEAAQAVDMEAVSLFTGDLASTLASQTSSGTTVGTSVSGEAISLATSDQLFMNDSINRRRTALSKEQLPTLLADGKFLDGQGTEYKYTQGITLGSSQITFGKSGESIDPTAMIVVGSTANAPLFNYTLSFVTNLNVSDSTYVQGREIDIMGTKYTVGSGSTNTTLYLFGAGTQASLKEGDSKVISVGGKDYNVTLDMVSSTPSVRVIVDGAAQSLVAKGGTVKVGVLEIYVRDIAYTGKTGQLSSADLNFGSTKMELTTGQAVKTGSNADPVLGTAVTIKGAGASGMISGFNVAEAYKDTIGDYISAGDKFTDRVFGSMKIEFSGLSPALTDTGRDKVTVSASDLDAAVKFTSALAGTAGEKTITFAHDTDGNANTLVKPRPADANNYTIHLVEGETAVLNDIIVVNDGDEGRLFKVTSIDASASSSKTYLQDAITGDNFEFNTATGGNATRSIGNGQYTVMVPPGLTSTNISVTWGSGASYGSAGDATTMFPRIKLKNGEWMAILYDTTFTNNTAIILPNGGDTIATSGVKFANTTTQYKLSGSPINWTMNQTSATATTMQITAIDTNNDGTLDCNFNVTNGPALLFIENKKTAESQSYGDAVCVPLSNEGSSSTYKVAIGTPYFTDTTASLKAWATNSYKSETVDSYGTDVLLDTTDLNNVVISYPSSRSVANVILGAVGSTATVTGGSSVAKLGDVVLTDVEAETAKVQTNLIVVGGSAVNKVSAVLVGLTYPAYGPDWTTATGAGVDEAVLKLVASPYSATKTALLVAGWSGKDTRAAAKALIDKAVTLTGKSSVVLSIGTTGAATIKA